MVGHRAESDDRHAKRFSSRRQSEKAARIRTGQREPLCYTIAINQQRLVDNKRGVGERRKPRAVDIFNCAPAAPNPAGGGTLEHAVLTVEQGERRSIMAFQRLLPTREHLLDILACHFRPPFSSWIYSGSAAAGGPAFGVTGKVRTTHTVKSAL